MLALIAAMAKNRVIGLNGDMPWHMPIDLQHFKTMTRGKPIIMGRKTFDSIGKPLPHRRNIVITRQTGWQADGCEVFDSLEAAIAACADTEEVMIVGGATIYQQALPHVDRMYLTYIDADVPGDTHFPAWDEAQWQTIEQRQVLADDTNPHDCQFVTLLRKDLA